jgi:hypothetical protein
MKAGKITFNRDEFNVFLNWVSHRLKSDGDVIEERGEVRYISDPERKDFDELKLKGEISG